ncbi:MAG: glycosyltransferase family 2 protein [Nanoarchaeota archaeon]
MIKLSIIIPVYNEEITLLKVIDKVDCVKLNDIAKEIIVVDDFSTDKTRVFLKKIKLKSIKIFYHETNKGKGAAIKTGLRHATGSIILIQDADLEYNPKEYKKLLSPIMHGNVKVVYGSRLKAIRKNMKKMYKLNYIGNLFLTLLTNLLYGAKITDMETGYKVFARNVLKGINLKSNGFGFEPEITAKILKKGYKIKEVDIDFNPRTVEEGKKISWTDGVKAVYYLLKYRIMD